MDRLKYLRKEYPELQLIGGNVATAAGALALAEAGVNAVKVGIGPGSICTTRIVTGCGVPQITAVSNAVEALEGSGITVIADGGIRDHGDIAKSIRFGASMVMMGSIFSGHEQSPGETLEIDGKTFKEYYGSASEFQKGERKNVEGKKIMVEHKGDISATLLEIKQDLQSSISYAGGNDLESLRKVDYVIVKNSIFNGDR